MQNKQKEELTLGSKLSIARAQEWFESLKMKRKREVRKLLFSYPPPKRGWHGTRIEYAYRIFVQFDYVLLPKDGQLLLFEDHT